MRPAHLTARRLAAALAVLAGTLVVTLVAATLIGPARASLSAALAPGGEATPDYAILFRARLPRVLLAAVVGGSLAAAGAALQALLLNPIAEPHLLGISAGAAVAGVVAIIVGADAASPIVPLAAFLGALGMITLVYLGARAAGRASPHAILLVGVVCNALAAAAIMLANAIVSYTQAQGILFWIMGSLSTQSYQLVAIAAAYALVGVAWIVRHAQDLNLLALGEESALELGVEVERTRRSVFVAASLLVGAAVAVSGMIGFVGLIVPHGVRLLIGADNRLLLPVAAGAGATFLVLADTLARVVVQPAELPVGVVTAFCGAPFFVYLLRTRLRRRAP